MRLSVASLVLGTFATFANAGGQQGGVQYPPCQANQVAQFVGCYNVVLGADPFVNLFTITPQTSTFPAITANLLSLPAGVFLGTTTTPVASSYNLGPALGDGAGYYAEDQPFTVSVTPYNCTVACRGHGYAYSALYADVLDTTFTCACAPFLPSTALINTISPSTSNVCNNNLADNPCPGDASQFCGDYVHALVYVDNSYRLVNTLTVAQQTAYTYVGCFNAVLAYNPTSAIATQANCFALCGSLGYPYAGFSDGSYLE